jgi:drug/metabolite transporter (DMT)-like permease
VSRTGVGMALATTTALAWGGQFVVGKQALGAVDAFNLTMVRYALAALVLLILLVVLEGRRSLRLEGRGLRLFWLGTLGFAGFNLFVYTGLEHTEPQNAALIGALAPLMTALVLWQQKGLRPARSTLVLAGVALVGEALVVSGGDPASIVEGSIGWGDALVLAGGLSFVYYMLGGREFPELSALRYTTLTATLGWFSIAALTVLAMVVGLEPTTSASAVWSVWPELLYISIIGAVIAVVAWNGAIARLGPQNAALFTNLIPVTTFAIEIVRGYRPNGLEIVGAALTLGALVAANLLARGSAQRAKRRGLEAAKSAA